jgi:hypothetical protein
VSWLLDTTQDVVTVLSAAKAADAALELSKAITLEVMTSRVLLAVHDEAREVTGL